MGEDASSLFKTSRELEFDEVAVRDFLVDDLGLTIPRQYRYDQGIHEIRKRLLTRFGDENYARAMGVFEDLMENEDIASGLGDDGDVFRSWRYDYKRRRENFVDPGTPRFPNLVLPATIPLSPVKRTLPYHKPLVIVEDVSSEKRFRNRTLESSEHGRTRRVYTEDPNSRLGDESMKTSESKRSRSVQVQEPFVRPDTFRSQSLRARDLPLRDTVEFLEKSKLAPSESTWFSGNLGPASRIRPKGARQTGIIEGDDNIVAKTNNQSNNEPGLGHRVRDKFSKLLQKEKHPDKNEVVSTIPPIPDTSTNRKRRFRPFGFDGTCDESDDEMAPPDLDRKLPPFPSHARQPTISRSATSTNHYRTTSTDRIIAPSTTSISHSRAGSIDRPVISSKSSFRNLARELVNPGLPPSPAAAESIHDPFEPQKFSPLSKASAIPAMSHKPKTIMPGHSRAADNQQTTDPVSRYRSIVESNPFSDEGNRDTVWPSLNKEQQAHLLAHAELLAQAEASKTNVGEAFKKKAGMVHSKSDGNVAFYARRMGLTEDDDDDEDHTTRPLSSPVEDTPRGRSRPSEKVKFVGETGNVTTKEQVIVDMPPTPPKRSRSPMKKMFGEHGWLGRTTSAKEKPNEQYQKTGLKHWGGKLKQRVEDITEDVSRMRIPNPFHVEVELEVPLHKKIPISMDPPAQAKLYSEIELMLCMTANNFLVCQRNEGRMSVESLTKVTEAWKHKGRPQVVEFMFDWATQRDLVLYNIKTFKFFGGGAESSVTINSVLYNWRNMAREFSIRTFCNPDSMIRKHLHDIYKILELLGAPLTIFLAFQDLQVRTLKHMHGEVQKRVEKAQVVNGVERPWYPPPRADSKTEMPIFTAEQPVFAANESVAVNNPFIRKPFPFYG